MEEKRKVGVAAFQIEESNLYKYTVPNAQTGDPLGLVYMRGFKQPALDRYRELRNGTGRAKGDNAKAREYLFRRTYVKFEFLDAECELDLGECKTEIEFFLTNCEMVVDSVVTQHLAEVFPDIDPKK